MVHEKASSDGRSSGFSLPFVGSEARRQFHISLGLVAMLAVGIVSASVAVGGHPLAVKQTEVASRAPMTVLQAETKVTGAKPI